MQVNKISSNSFTGSLVLPSCFGDTVTLTKDDITSIKPYENSKDCTKIEYGRHGCHSEIVPISIDKVLAAYSAAALAPESVEIDLSNLYA